MKLAIITCSKLPQGVADDHVLFEALKQTGLEIQIHAWDAPVQWSQFDACLFRSVWDYHKQPQAFLKWLDKTSTQTKLINSADLIKWNSHKVYLKELADFGISIAPTLWLETNKKHPLKKLIEQLDSEQYFLKPVIGADSSGTFRFSNTENDLKAAQNHLDEHIVHQEMMLQPYLNAVELLGETSGIFFNGAYSHAVRKTPINGDYRVQDTFGAIDTAYELNAVEMALSKACMCFMEEKFGPVIYARFDFLHDHNGVIYLNEAELFEPSLFFNHSPNAAQMFATSVKSYMSSEC